MKSGSAQTLRYEIEDEPKRSVLTRFAIPPFFLLPLTIYGALVWSVFLWVLPGLNAFLVNGTHKWRELGYSVLALVLFLATAIGFQLLDEAKLLSDLARAYSRDVVLAITVLPLFRVLLDQQFTIEMRKQLGI